MPIIIREQMTGIGYGVTFSTTGKTETLNFASQPTIDERDELIARYERLWTDDVIAERKLDIDEEDD